MLYQRLEVDFFHFSFSRKYTYTETFPRESVTGATSFYESAPMKKQYLNAYNFAFLLAIYIQEESKQTVVAKVNDHYLNVV